MTFTELVSWAHSAANHHSKASGQNTSGSSSNAPGSSGSSGSSTASSNPYANGTDCGGGLFAGPNTSCPFAQSVQQAYNQAPGMDATVQAYSPVTNQTYTMSCSPAGAGVTCSGANNASVSWSD